MSMAMGAKEDTDIEAEANADEADISPAMSRHILVIATEELAGEELIEQLARELASAPTETMVIAPAVEETAFHHALGDVDGAAREARKRLDRSLAALREAGVQALGEVGDSDPVLAAEDVLRRYPAEEVWIVTHAEDQALWFEDGLFERAQEELYPAVRMLTVRRDDERGELHPVGVESSGPGRRHPPGAEHEIRLSQNLSRFTRGDVAGMIVGILGTIVAIVLAAAGPGPDSAAGAAAIMIAMGIALVNMAHVVGLVLLESVSYRGGWQRLFRNLSIVGTPLAILANLLILVLD
jgi:hypothetical protein